MKLYIEEFIKIIAIAIAIVIVLSIINYFAPDKEIMETEKQCIESVEDQE